MSDLKVEELENVFERVLGMRENSLKVLLYILAKGRHVTPREIVEEMGLSQNTVWKAVRRLEAAGLIRSVERGSYEANYGLIIALLLLKVQKMVKVAGEKTVE